MKKLPSYIAILSSIVVCGITPALAQNAAYPQGYEAPQADAYRGQAQQSSSFGNTQAADSSTWARQQAIEAGQPNTSSNTAAIDKPIKASHGHLLGVVGHIGQAVGRAAVPVAMMGGMYMVQKAAINSGMQQAMMAQRMGMPMGGYGMNPMMGGGYGMNPMMGGMGGYGMPMGGYGYNPMMNMMRGY